MQPTVAMRDPCYCPCANCPYCPCHLDNRAAVLPLTQPGRPDH